MADSNLKPKKIGYQYGLVFLVFGLAMIGVNAIMLYLGNNYFPKLLAIGIALSILSLVFFIFPGGVSSNKMVGKDINKELWNNAPRLHKIMWIIWAIVSVICAVFALISFDPEFYE